MYNEVSPGYFGTVGMRLLAGRDFTRGDIEGGPKVAIVNEAFARKFKLTGHVVGSRMASESGNDAKLDIEIVGLVKDAKYSSVKREIPPVYFTPYRQDKEVGAMTLLRAHAARRQDALLQAIPRLVARLDPNLPVEDLRSMDAADPPEHRRRSHDHDPLGVRSPSSRRCSRRSGSTACSPTPWRSGRARSACGWRSAPTPAASAG